MNKLARFLTAKLASIAFDILGPKPTPEEINLINELKSTFRKIPIINNSDASKSAISWNNNMKRLHRLVLKGNPREFLRWDVVRNTMFTGDAGYIREELNFLENHSDWKTRWKKAIEETPAGNPVYSQLHFNSSGNLIHHTYHIAQFEENTSIKINDIEIVFEFGGGYGSMCRLFHNLGFKGKYIVFDLPLFSALQIFFLKTIGIPVLTVETFKSAGSGVVCISDIKELKNLLGEDIQKFRSMFVATWSISETPLNFRDSILPIVSNFKSFLIAYQNQFCEVNNSEFFNSWEKQIEDKIEWHTWQIEHLKGSSYLVGKTKCAVEAQ